MLNDEYYLWGAGTYGGRIIDFMKDDLTFKAVIDNDPKKQGTVFHGIPVVSYDKIKNNLPKVKVVVSMGMPHEIRNFLLGSGFVERQDFYLVYDFFPRYYWMKNRLVSSHANLIATTICNMRCETCQTYIPIAKNHKHFSAEQICADVDNMFSYVDAFMNINFPCGESLLNEELTEACSYIHKKYTGRYQAMAIQTNGSVIPKDEIMHSLNNCGAILSISDYPENQEIKKRLIESCEKFGVSWFINSTCEKENWYNFADSRIVSETDSVALRERYHKCWIPGTGIFEGWLYLCTVQAWSHAVVDAGTRESGDVFDLRQPKTDATREEVYRLISRQPERGYISHCMRCNGTVPISERANK